MNRQEKIEMQVKQKQEQELILQVNREKRNKVILEHNKIKENIEKYKDYRENMCKGKYEEKTD